MCLMLRCNNRLLSFFFKSLFLKLIARRPTLDCLFRWRSMKFLQRALDSPHTILHLSLIQRWYQWVFIWLMDTWDTLLLADESVSFSQLSCHYSQIRSSVSINAAGSYSHFLYISINFVVDSDRAGAKQFIITFLFILKLRNCVSGIFRSIYSECTGDSRSNGKFDYSSEWECDECTAEWTGNGNGDFPWILDHHISLLPFLVIIQMRFQSVPMIQQQSLMNQTEMTTHQQPMNYSANGQVVRIATN